MAQRLSEEQIAAGVASLAWRRDGDILVKEVVRTDFADAMTFVNRIADVAELANHHPDITISWNRVTLHLTTHSAGGLTQSDLDLASEVDQLG